MALLTIILLLGAVSSSLAFDRDDYRINDDGGTAAQTAPSIAVTPRGEFAVVWGDRRLGRAEVFCQIFDPDGSPKGRNTPLSSDSSGSERFQPEVAADGLGRFSAIWKDFRNGNFPFSPDLYQLFLDTLGARLTDEINLTASRPDSIYEEPEIALFPNGSGIAVWAEYRSGNWDILGSIFDERGLPQSEPFQINDDSGPIQQHAPQVSVSPQGWFAVTWYDNRLGSDHVYVQPFDAAGDPVGQNILANDVDPGVRQTFPAIACDGSNRFTLCWTEWGAGQYPFNSDIYLRRFTSSGAPLDKALQIAVDSFSTSQKEPAIATDRLGNVAVVWSDSSRGTWDIVGQIIDNHGELQGANFTVNQDTLGRQVQPDVAMDGFDIRIVWSDLRNGNFDIYGRIQNYNQPALIAMPPSLSLSMHTGGPAPEAEIVVLLNAGLGKLDFSVLNTVSWLRITPTSGAVPEALEVTVVDQSLDVGRYLATILLIDETTGDSSATLTVSLDVTTSEIELSVDTVHLIALAQIGDPEPVGLMVSNSGSGSLSWSASEEVSWLQVSPASGADDDSVMLIVDVSALALGEYSGVVLFSDPLARNSPESLVVILSYVSDEPYISLSKSSLQLDVQSHTDLTTGVRILNLGVGGLSWLAQSSSAWLEINTPNGVETDSLLFRVNTTGLLPGAYSGLIEVSDSGAINGSAELSIALAVTSADTLVFAGAQVSLGEEIELKLSLRLIDSVSVLSLPLYIDSQKFHFDSLRLADTSVASPFTLSSAFDSLSGMLSTQITASPVSIIGFIPPQEMTELLTLYLTADSANSFSLTEELIALGDSVTLRYSNGVDMTPKMTHGEISVGLQTSVADDVQPALPETIQLTQNTPNPFNSSTQFSAYLPHSGQVEVRIYNILGQTVRHLLNDHLERGWTTISWDGYTGEGLEAPTGIYFYELRGLGVREVKKALLIK